MEALTTTPDRLQENRFECRNGWYRLAIHCESRRLPELSDLDWDGYRIVRFQTAPSRLHFAIFRGASFSEEVGESPTEEALERGVYWNDCLLISYDRTNGNCQILSNRAASIPVFWTSDEGQTLVSNNMAWLGGRGGPVDRVAFAETLLWDVPLGERTFRKNIRQLPAGYRLLISSSGVRTQKAFALNIRPSSAGSSAVAPEEFARQGAALNSRAVQRAVSRNSSLILPISGGLDSRCILGSLTPLMRNCCRTVSFGQPGALEIQYGRSVAERCGVPWRSYALNADHYTGADLQETIRAGCGMTPLQHLHLSSALRQLPRGPSQVPIGFMGDPIAGADSLEKSDTVNADGAVAIMFRKAGLTAKAAAGLFGRETADEIANDIARIYRDATAANPIEAFLEYYFIVERQSKLVTHIFNHLQWSGHGLGFPFMDGEWARFFLSLPPELRAGRTLFKRSLALQRPDLAGIPSTADFATLDAAPLFQQGARFAARNWNRICTLSQRMSGYRYSLPNPFATELQGVVLRGPLKDQLARSIGQLCESGLISDALAVYLKAERTYQHPWTGMRAISAALCLEEEAL